MLLVTGITGRTGRFFLQQLIDNHYIGKIRCVVMPGGDIKSLKQSGLDVEIAYGDLHDQTFLDRALQNIDTVLHITSISYTINILKAAIKNQVKRVIAVHTTGIYSKFKIASEEYQQIEQEIEQMLKQSQSSPGFIILRPTMIYGYPNDNNMSKFIKMVDKLKLFPVIDYGKSLLQPVNGRDLGKAYYQVLTTIDIKSGDYILSGEKPISMLDIFRMIGDLLGKKSYFISIPLWLGVLMARILYAITLGRCDYIEKVQRMGEDRSFPHEAASKDFGYQPMPFADGLRIEINEYLAITRGSVA